MDELPLYTMTSPSLQFGWTGSCPQFILTSSSLNSDGRAPTIHTDELCPQDRRTSSCLLIILTSSSLNSDGRAPTIHTDELCPQDRRTSSCLLIILTSSSPQLRWTSSYYSHRRALPSRQIDELLPINHIHELFPQLSPL